MPKRHELKPVKRVVQNREASKYHASPGEWVDSVNQARDFKSITEVVDELGQDDLQKGCCRLSLPTTEGTRVPPTQKLRVVIVDDHAQLRRALSLTLEDHLHVTVVGEADSAANALAQVARLRPDLVLMDVNLPDRSGIDATHDIIVKFPNVRVIGCSMHDAEYMAEPMRAAGACGYLWKGAPWDELINELRPYCTSETRGRANSGASEGSSGKKPKHVTAAAGNGDRNAQV